MDDDDYYCYYYYYYYYYYCYYYIIILSFFEVDFYITSYNYKKPVRLINKVSTDVVWDRVGVVVKIEDTII